MAPIGNVSVSDERITEPIEELQNLEEQKNIAFAGYGRCTVSAERPNIELENPAGNFVDMVFTVKDKATGDVIARTGKVAAGKYAYVNVVDYYKTPGEYNLQVEISTTDATTGAAMSGMNQGIELTVE